MTELLIGIESTCEAENSDQFSNKKGPDLKQPACPAAIFPVNACVSNACTRGHSEAQSHAAWSYRDAASTQRPPGTDQHGLSRPSHQPRETGINTPLVGKRFSRRRKNQSLRPQSRNKPTVLHTQIPPSNPSSPREASSQRHRNPHVPSQPASQPNTPEPFQHERDDWVTIRPCRG